MKTQASLAVFITLLLVGVLSCTSTKKATDDGIMEATLDERILDTLVVTSPMARDKSDGTQVYHGSVTRKHDLLHTRLEVAFDWNQQHVLGKAELELRPLFYETDSLVLDAKGFDIHSISMNGRNLNYEYDNQQLSIILDKVYTRHEKYKIKIDYTAKPNEGPSNGSQAITSDKGLFFINPMNENKFKPQQIWTQGETENNSRWFPTIDKPNERCSQEVYITVENRFQTLSNGLLLSSTDNGDGTRTDYWSQALPHAPYLFMLGIGEYAVVKDEWQGKELMYYVEPEYAAHAEKIFNHTPEMLSFFSEILGYPYPWDKYAQIVCRDYVSGAMENTGAVVFGDFVQRTERELLDGNNDDIVAHELFHHWFGDLVTCESWSNLTLNEGFATYSEFLWQEYKYGKEAAERKRIDDLNGYVMTADRGGTHDLIDFEYDDKEDMFDGHSYNKGSLVVHMLRNLIGDEAFFASLQKYLEDNAYTDVEAHELRLAFEDVTGMDLNWFFNQWFFSAGHPILDVEYSVDKEIGKIFLDVSQTQDPEDNVSVFKLPLTTMLYYPDGQVEEVDWTIKKRKERKEIAFKGDEPPLVVLDGKHDLLAVISEERTNAEWVDLYRLSDEYEDKYRAISKLKGKAVGYDITREAASSATAEMRLIAASNLNMSRDKVILKELALNDLDPKVRTTALKKMNDYDVALALLKKDQSYRVLSQALDIIEDKNPDEAIRQAEIISMTEHRPIMSTIGDIFSSSKNTKYLNYFEDNVNNVSMYAFFNYMGQYTKLAKQASAQRILTTTKTLKAVAMEESNSYFKKYSATNAIKSLMTEVQKNDPDEVQVINELSNYITKIVNSSSDERLKAAFSEYMESP